MTKYSNINVRLTQNEKAMLEEKATSLCMTLSEYVRFKLLDDEDIKCNNEALEWLNKNYKIFFRFLIKGAGISMAHAQLKSPEDMYSIMEKQILKKYKEMNIEMENKQ